MIGRSEEVVMADGKIKVLFLCTGNSARSQMAEAFLRAIGGPRYEAFSAGIEPKGIHPLTRQVMQEVGISLDGQTSKDVRVYMGHEHFGYLITVCDHADKNCPTAFVGVSQRLHWSFEDPAACEGSEAEKLAMFRQVRDQIAQRVKEWVRD
jgi:arsenate reductase